MQTGRLSLHNFLAEDPKGMTESWTECGHANGESPQQIWTAFKTLCSAAADDGANFFFFLFA